MSNFDPDATGVANGNYFGFEFNEPDAALVLLSVPWDVTVSYRAGSAAAPASIIDASTQVEIYDEAFPGNLWQMGIATARQDEKIAHKAVEMRQKAENVISHIENAGHEHDPEIATDLREVNDACQWLNNRIYEQSIERLKRGKTVGLVGGDHSTPLGLVRALSAIHPDGFGVLHIDAHADLRDAYEGFEYSHASIMRNMIKLDQVERLVQVGIRDFSHGEAQFADSEKRIVQFSDRTLTANEFKGETWDAQCDRIIANLPQKVYISFDIDGLAREFCPTTGTPVPGGLSWHKAVYLLEKLGDSHRQIIGFDLNEVAPNAEDEWDSIVGARMLYKLSLLTLKSAVGQ